ncbi:uncharacterized protein LOC143020726 isoform X2 [Oratosquilla oratoria]|uniref:uncharacterized protein LOC143020726 isoform X2 n=1 Tax=Oratosquilla oratoria TaxID=337810 RepID=UPI003F75A67F
MEEGCGPPPTKYDPKTGSKGVASSIDKSARWKEEKEKVPGPGAYNLTPSHGQGSPQKKHSSRSRSRFNSSSVSSTSTGSNTSELGPPKSNRHLSHSVSAQSIRPLPSEDKAALIAELENSLKMVTSERDLYKDMLGDLEKRLQCNQRQINNEEKRRQSCSTPKKANGCSMAETPEKNTEGEDQTKENTSRTKWAEELEENLKLLKDKEIEIATLKESVQELWKQNDELKAALEKEEEGKESSEALQSRILSIETHLEESQSVISKLTSEKTELDNRVKEMQEYTEQKSLTDEELKQLREENEHLLYLRENLEGSLKRKDELIIEAKMQLELVVEESKNCHDQLELYESRILSLEDSIRESFEKKSEAEVHVKSLVAKYESLMREHHMHQQFHKDIIGQKDIEIELLNDSLATMNAKISKYEQSIVSLQGAMYDREGKISSLESAVGDLSLRTKEKEVMECMLQDEIQCKEVEMNNLEEGLQDLKARIALMFEENESLSRALDDEKSNGRDLVNQMQHLELQLKEKEVLQQFLEKEIGSREAELETARQVALDLQEETEGMLNEVLMLKSAVDTKDYALDEKEDQIKKMNEKNAESEKRVNNMVEKLTHCEEALSILEEKHKQLQETNKELEERVVELMAEVSDREAEHKKRVEAYESDIGEMSIKYSETLLEHEATRRALKHTAEELDKEKFLRLGTEGDLEAIKEESIRRDTEIDVLERNLHDMTEKFTALECALATSEMENMALEERMKKEVRDARTETACAQNEIQTLQTSNKGFLSQITRLKTDMQKKSSAVDEMQVRLDKLREERAHLVTLRDNLEANVATKEKAAEDLGKEREEERLKFEEREGALHSKIGDLENHLKEAEDELAGYKAKTMELENKLDSLEEEKERQVGAYDKQVNEYITRVSSLTDELESLKSHYESYDDQLNNLQTSLLEKTGVADELQQTKRSLNHTLEVLEEEKSKLESSVFSLKGEVEVLNTTLAGKEESLVLLNDSLALKDQELEKLSKSLEEKQTGLEEAEKKIKEAEEKVKTTAGEKNEFKKELVQTRATLNVLEDNIKRLKEHEENSKKAGKRYEEELLQAIANAERLEKALEDVKEKNAYLEALIEPFREQLDAFEAEKIGLLCKSSAAQEEINKLSKQYAALLGHTNHKQKVHHVQKLKIENNQLREEVMKHMQETEKQRKIVKRLEEKLERSGISAKRSTLLPPRAGDKENLSFRPDASMSAMSSTPLKPANKPQRL